MLFSGLQPVPPAMYAASRAAERPATARKSDDAPPYHKAVAAHVLPVVLRRRQQNATIAKATDPKLRVDAEFDDDPLLPHHRRSDWREAFFHAMKPAAPAPPPTKVASTARTTTDEDDAGGEEA